MFICKSVIFLQNPLLPMQASDFNGHCRKIYEFVFPKILEILLMCAACVAHLKFASEK